jgi:hypothetical protein
MFQSSDYIKHYSALKISAAGISETLAPVPVYKVTFLNTAVIYSFATTLLVPITKFRRFSQVA